MKLNISYILILLILAIILVSIIFYYINLSKNLYSWKRADICYDFKRKAVGASTLDECLDVANKKKYTHIDFYNNGCSTCSQPGYKCYLSHYNSPCNWGPPKLKDNVNGYSYY